MNIMNSHSKQNNAVQPMDAPTRRKLGNIWYLIGLAWQCGDVLDENERLAIDSFRRAAGYGNTEAMRCLADYCVYRDRDLMKAMDWWMRANRIIQSSAARYGGQAARDRDGVSKQNDIESRTVKWYREAAERGCASAQAHLGECLFRGQGTKRNRREGIKWFRLAANQGNARAMLCLGICYLFGYCVNKNEAKAYSFWLQSAELGYAEAQYYIALCYENGEQVERNHEEALKWFRLAAAQGHRDARKELETWK